MKIAKRQAARRIRLVKWDEEIPDGKAYRKYYNPWDIHDATYWVDDPYDYSTKAAFHRFGMDGNYWAKIQEREDRQWKARYFKRNGKFWKRS